MNHHHFTIDFQGIVSFRWSKWYRETERERERERERDCFDKSVDLLKHVEKAEKSQAFITQVQYSRMGFPVPFAFACQHPQNPWKRRYQPPKADSNQEQHIYNVSAYAVYMQDKYLLEINYKCVSKYTNRYIIYIYTYNICVR